MNKAEEILNDYVNDVTNELNPDEELEYSEREVLELLEIALNKNK